MTTNTNRTAPAGHTLNADECFPRCQREGEHVFTRTEDGLHWPAIASKAQPSTGALAESGDATVCNTCRCAFCEKSEGQIIDLCPLHAAAPDLLAALQGLASPNGGGTDQYMNWISWHNSEGPTARERVEAARAAILRAQA